MSNLRAAVRRGIEMDRSSCENAVESTPRRAIFVYGTLKRSFPNAGVMPSSTKFVAMAKTVHKYPLVVDPEMGIPFVIDEADAAGAHCVRGELYTANEKAVRLLDEFEGVPNMFYKRDVVHVELTEIEKDAHDHCEELAQIELSPGEQVQATCYYRHPESKGPQWAHKWSVSELSKLEKIEEYTLEMAKKYVPHYARP